jgi:hypothetical protein
MAICGTSCNISVGGNTYEAHYFTIDTATNEFDVRAFGDGEYGSWLACAKNGTITVRTYAKADVAPGEVANISANVGAVSLTASNCPCTRATADVDAKGVVEFVYTFRLVSDITNW